MDQLQTFVIHAYFVTKWCNTNANPGMPKADCLNFTYVALLYHAKKLYIYYYF
jgi:hypothetical protein